MSVLSEAALVLSEAALVLSEAVLAIEKDGNNRDKWFEQKHRR